MGVLYCHAILVRINRRIRRSIQREVVATYCPQPEGLENTNNQEKRVTDLWQQCLMSDQGIQLAYTWWDLDSVCGLQVYNCEFVSALHGLFKNFTDSSNLSWTELYSISLQSLVDDIKWTVHPKINNTYFSSYLSWCELQLEISDVEMSTFSPIKWD